MFYDKDKLKEELELAQVYDLLAELGGDPEYKGEDVIISRTICHNPRGEGSRKLYYYAGTRLLHCYTGCENASFDVFELVCKAMKIQRGVDWSLPEAMEYVASYFGLVSAYQINEEETAFLEDWALFKRYEIIKEPAQKKKIELKEYNANILTRLSYPRISSWELEGISPQVIKRNLIGYYPTTDQITIPHFDIRGRFIGLRGRFLSDEDVERFGKYRPVEINNLLYSHPLSMNLYNLNNSRVNIEARKVAIIFESEKACLQYQSMYGPENDISVACCGSNISSQQIEMLTDLGVSEIIIAFDRQFQEIGDNEFKALKKKLITLYKKYGYIVKITAIFDKNMITPYKASPTDCSKEIFEQLLKERFEPKDR